MAFSSIFHHHDIPTGHSYPRKARKEFAVLAGLARKIQYTSADSRRLLADSLSRAIALSIFDIDLFIMSTLTVRDEQTICIVFAVVFAARKDNKDRTE
jgi:hypothetical protein